MTEGGAAENRVVVEGALPRDGLGRLLVPFRSGDVLRVSLLFVDTTVIDATESAVTLRWPWRRNGRSLWLGAEFTFSLEEPNRSWLYRTEPPLRALRAGQRCRVGIPPTLVYVLLVDRLDVPQDTGMLPQPSGWLVTLPAGVSFDPSEPVGLLLELIAAWGPDGPTPGVELVEPIRMELVFRPYAFLADGDVVIDAGGCRWRFEVPYWWRQLDGRGEAGPRGEGAPDWPLRLSSEDGESDPMRAAEVAAATVTGSHAGQMARWRELARAEPVPVRHRHVGGHRP
jgi:hypothetical protein